MQGKSCLWISKETYLGRQHWGEVAEDVPQGDPLVGTSRSAETSLCGLPMPSERGGGRVWGIR